MRASKTKLKLAGALGAAGLLASLGCAQASAGTQKGLASAEAQQGYSLGHAIGLQMTETLGGVDPSAFVEGLSDAIYSREASLGPEEMKTAILDFETKRQEATRESLAALAATNAQAGDAYREKFALEPGVSALDNGLLYKVIEPGAGDPPAPGSSVTIHYRGSLVDGTPLDDSYSRGAPVTIPLEGSLPGWAAALERMPAGAKWQVVIPPSLAYGETGAGDFIGPNTTLVFELERVAS